MGKKQIIKSKDEPISTKKITKKTTEKVEKSVEKKEITPKIKVLIALNNTYPRWINGLVLEKDLLEAIHPVHLRNVLDELVSDKMVLFDIGNFSYQITELGKNLLDSM